MRGEATLGQQFRLDAGPDSNPPAQCVYTEVGVSLVRCFCDDGSKQLVLRRTLTNDKTGVD